MSSVFTDRSTIAVGGLVDALARLRPFWNHRELTWQLAKREVAARYRGSFFGAVWSLLNPLLLLGVYSFVFSYVFQSRWGGAQELGRLDYTIALFGSLTFFNLFSETITAAPLLVVQNANYVKRVVFPLEILPISRFLSCGLHASVGLGVYLAAAALSRQHLPWTFLLTPLLIFTLAGYTIGLAALLASLGVFVRDIGHVVGLGVTMLLFLSPVFYPLSNLPPGLQSALGLNPMAILLEDFRRATLDGIPFDPWRWLAVTAVGAVVLALGMACFIRSKRAFADVL